MTVEILHVLLNTIEVGVVERRGARLKFIYKQSWREDADAYPISLSMPLAASEHKHSVIEPFIWGLLPDNERTLDRWAKQFQISARNPFALIAAVGEDSPGAIQFIKPEKLEELISDKVPSIDWLTEEQIARRLQSTLDDASSGRTAADNGQFSLAGAQPKTALLRYGKKWGIPSGRLGTNTILKPPSKDFDGHAENEHFCLRLANILELKAATSEVLHFEGQAVIVVQRYDRITRNDEGGNLEIARIHQEDMCQALGVGPDKKYQNEGGPSAVDIIRLINDSISQQQPLRAGQHLDSGMVSDMWRFIDALIYNWIIGGTDAHAKNYSFLIGSENYVRLAPLYDIASAYGYPNIAPQRMKLAMKVARKYKVEDIVLHHWIEWAREAKVNPDILVERIKSLAQKIPEAAILIKDEMAAGGLNHPIISNSADTLSTRAAMIANM